MTPEQYHANAEPRKDLLKKLRADAIELQGDEREILCCFMCDPYQFGLENNLTREALEILAANDLRVQILTKGGTLACRDFDIVAAHGWKFATTILLTSQKDADEWEPNAAPLSDRKAAVMEAHKRGIKTWVSVEPVIYPDQALRVIEELLPFVDFWKVGKMNHDPNIESRVDWEAFLSDVESLLCDRPHLIKKDLAKFGKGTK